MPSLWLVLRLALLLLTAIGTAGMHTLGHASVGSHGGADRPQPAHVGEQRSIESNVLVTAAARLALPVEAAARAGSEVRGVAVLPDPLAVCLAILAVGIMVLLAALRAAYRRRVTSTGLVCAAFGVAGRGPPPRPRIGLHLADLSVQRN